MGGGRNIRLIDLRKLFLNIWKKIITRITPERQFSVEFDRIQSESNSDDTPGLHPSTSRLVVEPKSCEMITTVM